MGAPPPPNAGGERALVCGWWACKAVQPLWKSVRWFLTKLSAFLPCSPAVKLLVIYPDELKTHGHTKTSIQMVAAGLFRTAQTWNNRDAVLGEGTNCGPPRQQDVPWRREQMSRESLRKTQRKERLSLSDRSPSEKATPCIIPTR